MSRSIVQWFPLWAVALSSAACLWPAPFAAAKPGIVPLLGLIMFSMGVTLSWRHFRDAARRPSLIGLALAIQFVCMPLFAYLIAGHLGLSTDQTVGMVLVGSSAGGTASNVICYLGRGNVALSILMTMASTLAAVIAMPALTYLYLNQSVQVPVWDMLATILKVVLLPVLLGTALNSLLGPRGTRFEEISALVSSIAIAVIIAIIVAVNRANFAETSPLLLAAVALHNGAGLAAGYGLARLLGHDAATCRTVSIEVGMQNSGLSVALAVKYFSSAAALPGALFSIWHNVSGSLLAAWWRSRREVAARGLAADRS